MDGPFGLAEGWDPASVLTAINEALLTGVCITDRHGNFVSVSNGWCAIYGVEPEEVLGQHFTIVVPPENRAMAARLHDEFIETGIELPTEWQVQRPDGQPVWIRVGAARFQGRDGAPFKVTTVEDITARKTAEQALADSHARLEQLNKDKDRLFSIIGHDLRGPFSPILGYADLMGNLGESLTVTQALSYAGRIQEAAGHALTLLDNLLDWARLHVEAHPVTPSRQSLAPVVQVAVDTLSSVAERKGLAVRLEMDPTLSVCVEPHMFHTVIRNLLSNAIKFTPEGGTITLRATAADGWATLDVADTGIGMKQADLNRILNDGESMTTNGTGNEPGTGLGLRVCREMMTRMGGRISGTSTPGEGATLTVAIPLQCGPVPTPAPDQRP
jgi:PAS domain S-box-containing protein